MPTFRCEFDVQADLVLPIGADCFQVDASSGVSIIFRNGAVDNEGHVSGLDVTVIGPAVSIESASYELRRILAEQLDLLAFATHSRFKIITPRRLVEWEAHQKSRQARLFLTQDARYPPDPELRQEYIDSLQALDQVTLPAFARTALKYFRYGLLDEQPEDQFMRLWLALEIVAENVKEKERVPIRCPKCSSPLKCETCDTVPTRVPMATQAIENLITAIAGADTPEIAKRQRLARNGLMHGRSRESIERECNMSMSQLVDELGAIAWHAIWSTIPAADNELTFGHRDGQFTNLSMVVAARLSFDHKGDSPHPTDEQIPSGKVEILTRFGNETEQSE